MTTVPVTLGSRSYDILIAEGALDQAATHLARFARGGRLVVVTDDDVAAAQLTRLEASLAAGGVAIEPIVLPSGEGTKSWRYLETLLDRLLALEVERSDPPESTLEGLHCLVRCRCHVSAFATCWPTSF